MSPAEDAADRLRKAVTGAMKRRDAAALAGLRSALAALANAEAVTPRDLSLPTSAAASEHIAGAAVGLGAAEAARRVLTRQEVDGVLRAEVDDREAAASELDALGQADRAARLRAEADAVRELLDGPPD